MKHLRCFPPCNLLIKYNFLQEIEKTVPGFAIFQNIFNRFNIWMICLLIQQYLLPLWLFEWYQFKKDSGDIEWIAKLIINDRSNCQMLYITCISGVSYYSEKCFYGAAAAPVQETWFSVLKFVTWTHNFLTKRTSTDVLGKTTPKG